jgi:NitT/TauT family transport system substrate-binding protein
VVVGRRELILRGFSVVAAVAIGDVLAACAPAAVLAPSATAAPSPSPMPPPETKTIRIALGACDAPQMISERYLQEEGFADIQLTDAGGLAALTGAKADLASLFVPALATAVDSGKAVVGLGGLHTGCAEMWAPQGVATLKDLRGHTVVVNAKTPDNLAYSMMAIALKNVGVDPSEVTFVVQADADLTKSFLDGKSDLLFLATTGAFAFGTNPANKGHLVLEQAMDAPWSQQDCCVITTTTDWLKANPIAAKRALRAIYRAADTLPKDRADAAKVATDKGLFGGSKNVELVRGAANMVPYDWRTYDVAASMRFHAQLLNAVSLIKFTPDEAVTKATDLRFAKELAVEIKR